MSLRPSHTKACCVVRAALLNADWQIAVILAAFGQQASVWKGLKSLPLELQVWCGVGSSGGHKCSRASWPHRHLHCQHGAWVEYSILRPDPPSQTKILDTERKTPNMRLSLPSTSTLRCCGVSARARSPDLELTTSRMQDTHSYRTVASAMVLILLALRDSRAAIRAWKQKDITCRALGSTVISYMCLQSCSGSCTCDFFFYFSFRVSRWSWSRFAWTIVDLHPDLFSIQLLCCELCEKMHFQRSKSPIPENRDMKKNEIQFFSVKDMHYQQVLTFLWSPIEWLTFC